MSAYREAPEPRCSTCRFFRQHEKHPGAGHCRISPPVVSSSYVLFASGGDEAMPAANRFPVVWLTDWCAEWRDR